MSVDKIQAFFEQHALLGDSLKLLGILILSYISFLLVRKFLIHLIERIARKSKTTIDDYLIESKTLSRLAYLIPVFIIDASTYLVALPESYENFISLTSEILMILIVLLTITALFNGLNRFYETLPISRERPVKGYLQVTNIVIILIGIIFIAGLITEKSPWAILTGIGALTAVLLLIFRDTILAFVAGIQITGYNLMHKGDWIEVPQYGADGDVIDIALHTVSVQNWDKTITIIPTHKLTEGGFKNWRGMQQSGGRRIKRSIYVDISSIRFCDDDMIEQFRHFRLLKDYVDQKNAELESFNQEHEIDDPESINRRRMTNIGTFRIYVEKYLNSHPRIHHDLTCMVRQLKPEATGLPIEIYAFANTTEWKTYESIQSDILDHIFAVVPKFDLRVFQSPAGGDIRDVAAFINTNQSGKNSV